MKTKNELLCEIADAIDPTTNPDPRSKRRAIAFRQARRAVAAIADMSDDEFDVLFNEEMSALAPPPSPTTLAEPEAELKS
jgi:hypothetical protein